MDKIDRLILANLLQNCDLDVLRENLSADGVQDLTTDMLRARTEKLGEACQRHNALLPLDTGAYVVLKTLVEFHYENDKPDEYYPDEPFLRLRTAVEGASLD